MGKLPICVYCSADQLHQGLFGNAFYHTFQILPYLLKNGIFPAWELRAIHYGEPPDYITIPGAVDLAYEMPKPPYRRIHLDELRRRHAQLIGNDWQQISRMWHAFFRTPQRVVERADNVFPAGRVLGLHYRGTDKLTTAWDSNAITQDDFITLAKEFIETQEPYDVIFAATDEISFVDKLRDSIDLPVINLGEVEFHLAVDKKTSATEKTDRAMLDCVLLSRCACVIETSSALPSFAKVLNPDIPVFRTAASKLFCDMPYFPVAHIPVLPVKSAQGKAILESTMTSDWTLQPGMERMQQPFAFRPRRPLHHSLFTLAEKLGAGDLITAER
jgi:hypothetical protein